MNSREINWNVGYECLLQFINREKHSKVPISWKEGQYSLGRWVDKQRQRYKNGKLEASQIQALNRVNFVWVAGKSLNSIPENQRRELMVERLREIVTKRNGRFDESEYRNKSSKIIFTCKEGHTWLTAAQVVLSGSWCRKCFYKYAAGEHTKLKDGLEQARKIASSRGGECISKEYVKSTSPLFWKCTNGHEWSAVLSDIKKGTWCPTCGGGARERLCRHYFEALTGEKFPKSRPDWLLNSRSNRMELDGFCENLSIAFEHQGKQHFEKVEHFNRRDETLEQRKKDDAKKRYLCKLNQIYLIEVPYHIPTDELATWISLALIEIGGFPREKIIPLKDSITYVASNELNELRLSARKLGGDCTSTVYKGVFEKHEFICEKGHTWSATASNVKQGRWCPKCKPERIGNSIRKNSVASMCSLAEKKGGQFLSAEFTSVNEKYEWECSVGHRWTATPLDVSKGTWCRVCSVSERKGTLEEMKKIADARGGKCLSNEYIDSYAKLIWRCRLGHEWSARPNNIKNRGSWCPVCARKK
jgi:hypothetical protein